MMRICPAISVAFLCALPSFCELQPNLDWQVTAYSDGRHNAFTDLIQWKDAWYLCFRSGTAHGSMDGAIRVMKSTDLKTWGPCGYLDTAGDDRDPHFAATPDALHVYFGTWDVLHGTGHNPPSRGSVRSHFASMQDGATWSKVQGVYEPGWWLWRVRYYDGVFYSGAYTAVRPVPPERETRLLKSSDGLEWTLVSTVTRERMAGEADFWFDQEKRMWLLSRTGDEAGDAELFHSDAALAEWEGQATGTLVHAPAVVEWKGRRFVAGRGKDGKEAVTRIWELKGERLEQIMTLPSGGDTSYPGFVLDPSTEGGSTPSFFVSWYSQHEKGEPAKDPISGVKCDFASVYVARITVSGT